MGLAAKLRPSSAPSQRANTPSASTGSVCSSSATFTGTTAETVFVDVHGRLLRDAGYNIRTANLEAGVAKAGTRGSTVSSGGYNVGGISTGWVNRPSHYNSQTEATRRQKGTTAHIKNLQAIDDMTGQIRRTMTERYQIEF